MEAKMPDARSVIRTEVRGLDLCLDETTLLLSRSGEYLTPLVRLTPVEAEQLAMEMAKAQLWEWNQFDELKRKAQKRYKNYLGSWLVMCVAAFSVYVGFPNYYLPVFLLLVSIVLWWRASFQEKRDDQAAREERKQFIPDWSYIRQRLEESSTMDNEDPPSAIG
jgi:hypothetical protein